MGKVIASEVKNCMELIKRFCKQKKNCERCPFYDSWEAKCGFTNPFGPKDWIFPDI